MIQRNSLKTKKNNTDEIVRKRSTRINREDKKIKNKIDTIISE